MDSGNVDVLWRQERRRMEKVEKQRKFNLSKLTRDAPEDFTVADTPEMEKTQKKTSRQNTKNTTKPKENVEPEDTVVPADETETHERQTQQERQQQAQETTPTYSNITTKNDVFHGKLTLISDIHGLTDFKPEQFCRDLAAKQPRAWQHVLGVQPIHRRVLEVEFDSEAAMTHILHNGLDTHDVHMTFTPDLPLVTTVSFWGIPLTMEKELVDENLQRYGEVKSSYVSKKNLGGRIIKTGVRVYQIQLKKSIPKFIQIGGKSIKSMYTGQEKQLAEERALRQKRNETERDERRKRRESVGDSNVEFEHPRVLDPAQTDVTDSESVADQLDEDKTATDRPQLTRTLFEEYMEMDMGFLHTETDHDEDRNPKASNSFITKLGKRKKARADSGDETTSKKQSFHKYKIDMDVLRYAVETNHVDLLPPGGFVGEDFTVNHLIALVYFMREGSLLNQEWYSEGFVPDPKLYLPEPYGIWKVLSCMNAEDIEDIKAQWKYNFEDYIMYLNM